MRKLLATLCLSTTLGVCLAGGVARAQTTADDLRAFIRDDLTALGVNMPVWMAQHIPSVMAPAGIGAGSGISDDSGGFTFGVMTRLGLFNNFDDVGYGLSLIDLQPALPSLLPWPQFGLVVGANLGDGFQLGADVQFIPGIDIAADNIRLRASLISVAVTGRWRANQAKGVLPALIFGLGASYYSGFFEVGGGFSGPYSETIEGHVVAGRFAISVAPRVAWSVFQLSPEVRLAWDVAGVFRPYVGFGVGFSFGDVHDGFKVHAEATITSIDGEEVDEDPVIYEDSVALFSTTPALWTLRPHVGFDVLLGPLVMTAQLDLAIMGKDELDGEFEEGAGSFDPSDPDYLYNENARKSLTQSALVATIAVRAQF